MPLVEDGPQVEFNESRRRTYLLPSRSLQPTPRFPPKTSIGAITVFLVSLCVSSLHGGCVQKQLIKKPRIVQAEAAPGIEAQHEKSAFWIARHAPEHQDLQLLDQAAIATLNTRNAEAGGAFQDVLDDGLADPAHLAREFADRSLWIEQRLADQRYIEAEAGAFAAASRVIENGAVQDELRLVVKEADLRCIPMLSALHVPDSIGGFDRNQCARLRVGELVRMLRQSEDKKWAYVNAGHSVGWVFQGDFTPPLTPEEAKGFRDPPNRLVVLADGVPVEGAESLQLGASVPLLKKLEDGAFQVLAPTTKGLLKARIAADASVHEGHMPLTRRNFLTLALAQLETPYGWGGTDGGRDCSRLTLDLMRVFGIQLGRHSSVQAKAGSSTLLVSEMSETEKRQAIRDASAQGLLFLYMPGHIMIYLGEENGRNFAISAIAEYLEPDPEGGDILVRIGKAVVSDLRVGRDTERTSFIERLQKVAVFGQ